MGFAIVILIACAARAVVESAGTGATNGFSNNCRWTHEAPTRCPQGNAHWSKEQLLRALPDFAQLYRRRPITQNDNGMNVNHAFALWFSVKQVRPLHVIESGVYHGQSTWLLRQAAGPNARIYSFDPSTPGGLKYKDESKNTRYFMGDNFVDMEKANWSSLIPISERERTFAMLDDHQSALLRSRALQRLGIPHLWYDDNWKVGGDCYSFTWMCSPIAAGTPIIGNVSSEAHEGNVQWLANNTDVYFEFPPILDGCSGGAGGSLLENASRLTDFGLPPLEQDQYHYWSLHPPYVKLKLPLAALASPPSLLASSFLRARRARG